MSTSFHQLFSLITLPHLRCSMLSYNVCCSLAGEDVWSYAKKLPHLFQQGGVFYNIVKKDMGIYFFLYF